MVSLEIARSSCAELVAILTLRRSARGKVSKETPPTSRSFEKQRFQSETNQTFFSTPLWSNLKLQQSPPIILGLGLK